MTAILFKRARGIRTLFSFSLRNFFVVCAAIPILAIFLCFILGSIFHPQLLYKYHWICHQVFLPSISRVINLPLERTIFQFLVLFHIPMRALVIFENYCVLDAGSARKGVNLPRTVMWLSGSSEMFFLVLLTTVGERESGGLHVLFFSLFTFSTYTYFISHSLSLHFFREKSQELPEKNGSRLQMGSFIGITFTIPTIFVCFILYNAFCVNYSYELFAIFEYLTVVFINLYHASEFYQMTRHCVVYHPKMILKSVKI